MKRLLLIQLIFIIIKVQAQDVRTSPSQAQLPDSVVLLDEVSVSAPLFSQQSLLFIGADGGIPSSIGKTLLETNPRAAAPNWKAIAGFKKYEKGVLGITLNNKISENFSNNITLFGKWNEDYEKLK